MDMVCRMAANTGPAQTAAAAAPAARLVAQAAGQAAAAGSGASEETADAATASLGFPPDAPEALLAALTQELRSQAVEMPSSATAGKSGETRPQPSQAACLHDGGWQGFARQGPARRPGINSPGQERVNESRGREGLGEHSHGGSSRVAALLERVRAAQADLGCSSSDLVRQDSRKMSLQHVTLWHQNLCSSKWRHALGGCTVLRVANKLKAVCPPSDSPPPPTGLRIPCSCVQRPIFNKSGCNADSFA